MRFTYSAIARPDIAMQTTTAARLNERFRALLTYIDENIDSDLSLHTLSQHAACSKFHFLRVFTSLYGITVADYVLSVRLRRAGHQLAFRQEASVLAIALANGFESAEAFARAFKRYSGQTPTQFRASPQWTDWQNHFPLVEQLKRSQLVTKHRMTDIQVKHFPETRIAVLEHRARPELLPQTIQRFIQWRKQNGLPPSKHATYNLIYDDPAAVAPEAFRFDLAVATDRIIEDNESSVISKNIPAGRCAYLRHIGSDLGLESSVRFLFEQWLPHSNEELRDFPLFFQRVSFYPDVAETQAVTDIYLPLQ